MLTYSENETILSSFPNIKLSYENISHKKVYNSDIILAIPEGKKCFAWFTTYNDNNVCFIMELAENKQIISIKNCKACFKSELVYNTIFYGTVFTISNSQFFTLEDIFYYKGKDVSRSNWHDKFVLFKNIMEHDISQISYNNSFIVFGLPILSSQLSDLMSKIKKINYKIQTIQFRSFDRIGHFFYMSFDSIRNEPTVKRNEPTVKRNNNTLKDTTKRETIFLVKPDIQNDIYHLYCNDDKDVTVYYDLAGIPDFTTSVIMNKLFRNIKENQNLDTLEESDDEEEFQNENTDRFVYLEKSYKMICAYHYKFKKWVPLRLAKDQNVKMITHGELSLLEKHKYRF